MAYAQQLVTEPITGIRASTPPQRVPEKHGVVGPYLLLTVQLLVWDVGRQVGVEESAEGQAVAPAAAEVGNVDVLWGKQRDCQTASQNQTRLHQDGSHRWLAVGKTRNDTSLLVVPSTLVPGTAGGCPNLFTEQHAERLSSSKHLDFYLPLVCGRPTT